MNKKYIIIIAIAVVIIVLAAGIILFPFLKKKSEERKDIEMRKSWQQEESHTTDIEVKNNGFVVYTNTNEEVNIDDHKDKPVFIIFWSSENKDSIDLIKRANTLYNSYKDKVNFFIISTDQEVNPDIEQELDFPIYYDFYQEAIRNMEVREVPAIITIDKENNILNSKGGLGSTDMLEANLELLVGEDDI
ncbi:MAG: redoxin domain-containing protein [Clostridia bacterium]|nr:redoxin domain-containing protein [Clostridia bacterium]